MPFRLMILAALMSVVMQAGTADAQGWGRLRGRVVYDGQPPAPEPIIANPALGNVNVRDESLVVGRDGGLKNVVVYLHLKSKAPPPPIHPDLAEAAKQPVAFNTARGRFDPHIALVQSNQSVIFNNLDPIAYNVNVDAPAQPVNLRLRPNARQAVHFAAAERLPSRVSCNIHPWMSGWLVIKDHPYMAVSDDQGSFEIDNLPEGHWTFQFWHEHAGYLKKVILDHKPAEWLRGRVTLRIENQAVHDLGEIRVNPAEFLDSP